MRKHGEANLSHVVSVQCSDYLLVIKNQWICYRCMFAGTPKRGYCFPSFSNWNTYKMTYLYLKILSTE
jgi:hypothetical protein